MFECATCTEYFSVQDACDYHMDEADHWAECDTCDQTFRSRRASEQHMDALDHRGPTFGCETCHKTFGASSAADQHMDAKNHWAPKVSCVQCGKKFHTQSAVEQHMRDLDHSDHYCRACDRCFDSANSLQMHQTSKVHRTANVACPYCMVGFFAISALAQHLEVSSCKGSTTYGQRDIFLGINEKHADGTTTAIHIEWG